MFEIKISIEATELAHAISDLARAITSMGAQGEQAAAPAQAVVEVAPAQSAPEPAPEPKTKKSRKAKADASAEIPKEPVAAEKEVQNSEENVTADKEEKSSKAPVEPAPAPSSFPEPVAPVSVPEPAQAPISMPNNQQLGTLQNPAPDPLAPSGPDPLAHAPSYVQPMPPAHQIPTPTMAAAAPAPVPAPAPATPAPAPAPAPAMKATQAENGAPQITLESIAYAGAALVDKGMMPQISTLLQKYNIQVITQLPKEAYPAFAADLRALGAQI